MINKRFSATSFEKLGRDSDEANKLHKDLAAEIAQRIHNAAYLAFKEIADELIALGHDLVEDEPEFDKEFDSWAYTFRDLGQDRGIFDHKLRIHLDTLVNTGYPNEKTEAEVVREYLEDDT